MENINADILQNGEYKFIELDGTKLFILKSGTIFRWLNNSWKVVENVNNCHGYNRIGINKKMISRHRIMCYTFKNLDINNPKQVIDHIDGDKLNNHIDNLRTVTNQQNQWNRTTAKGYYWDKKANKWCAKIKINGKTIHLGAYTDEESARKAYVDAKSIYHIIDIIT